MSAAPDKNLMNATTVLLSILIGISGWSLVTLIEVKDQLGQAMVRVDNHEKRINDLAIESRQHAADIVDLRISRANSRP